MSITAEAVPDPLREGPNPVLGGQRTRFQHAMIYVFVGGPMLALIAAVPLAWGWGVGWHDLALLAGFYAVAVLGITVGFHRHFTHKAFKTKPWLRVALAISGSLAVQGNVFNWVADHRRHHAFSDKEGDPHSPWAFGTSPAAVAKGFLHAHMGWFFDRNETNHARFIPDLLADRAITRVARTFGLWVAASLLLPAVIGGLVTWSWQGAVTGFFWGGLVRLAISNHVTWSINSICHMVGKRPFRSRDRSRNFWPLAVLSMGESWHNLHHADPTCARHGVLPGQIDISARVIWIFERFGWAHDVRWPTPARLAKLADR
ncbi:acyl-CoA desaturase [Pseudonocardia abyssalis]|uniref:Acyl-CoA desaturase n=1 Tax=Pseudonocardia abyssalis TaxID=2792008 RepID=A0ABS6UX69_9PSEU|nr:acyl-CoA desaturase [Pseudonocardia abyssalis]MBW0117084.1 acyl-CoA desaturase [Pseudonocardia abyssalis]MBW0136586.1 acyl-CoA desaturase [Pseudonocardia abyssalis]